MSTTYNPSCFVIHESLEGGSSWHKQYCLWVVSQNYEVYTALKFFLTTQFLIISKVKHNNNYWGYLVTLTSFHMNCCVKYEIRDI